MNILEIHATPFTQHPTYLSPTVYVSLDPPALSRHDELRICQSHSSIPRQQSTHSAFLEMRVRRNLLKTTSTDKIPKTSQSKTEQVLGLPEILLAIPSG